MLITEETVCAGDVGTEIILDCKRDVSSATSVSITVTPPRGTKVEWAASPVVVDGSPNFIRHTIIAGELAIPGKYALRAKMTLGSWTGHGKKTFIVVGD